MTTWDRGAGTPTSASSSGDHRLPWDGGRGRREPGVGRSSGSVRGSAGGQQRGTRLGPPSRPLTASHVPHFRSSWTSYFYASHTYPKFNCSSDLRLNQL